MVQVEMTTETKTTDGDKSTTVETETREEINRDEGSLNLL